MYKPPVLKLIHDACAYRYFFVTSRADRVETGSFGVGRGPVWYGFGHWGVVWGRGVESGWW